MDPSQVQQKLDQLLIPGLDTPPGGGLPGLPMPDLGPPKIE
jgi:hypothetical protein